MPFRKTMINPQTQKEETGTVLDIIESNEPIIRIKLEDGTLVRIKQSIIEAVRMDQKNENGEEVYNFDCNMIVRVIPVEEQEND